MHLFTGPQVTYREYTYMEIRHSMNCAKCTYTCTCILTQSDRSCTLSPGLHSKSKTAIREALTNLTTPFMRTPYEEFYVGNLLPLDSTNSSYILCHTTWSVTAHYEIDIRCTMTWLTLVEHWKGMIRFLNHHISCDSKTTLCCSVAPSAHRHPQPSTIDSLLQPATYDTSTNTGIKNSPSS